MTIAIIAIYLTLIAIILRWNWCAHAGATPDELPKCSASDDSSVHPVNIN